MRAEAVVVLGAAAGLFILGILAFVITDMDTVKELVPGGDPENEDDYVPVQVQVTPFRDVGVSSVLFGVVVVLAFLGLAVAARRSR